MPSLDTMNPKSLPWLRAKKDFLSTFLSLPSGIPCADTFGRVFARLEEEQMQTCFVSWVNSISKLLGAEVIGIDGKTLRHSGGQGCGKAAIPMVSAFSSANRARARKGAKLRINLTK